ncbi:MAG: hypothetical protein FJ253_04910 [Phycisphaerae bacterium]|nr:hypothetical protein [Phycisphaerae bacterium]
MGSRFAAARFVHVALALAAVAAAPASSQSDGEDECAPFWVSEFGAAGADGTVYAFAIFDDGRGEGPCLFVGGLFGSIGGVPANFVAKWNGTTWSPLGSGTNATVRSFAVFDEGMGQGPSLFVGGNFTSAGGMSANGIARWNGVAWSPVSGAADSSDNGVNGSVLSMAVFDDGSGAGPVLHVGGWFSAASGTPAPNVARWNGSSWSAMGNGLDGSVFTFAAYDDGSGDGPALYTGGWFTKSGATVVNRIARWNGSEWTPVGEGVDSGVHALAVWDDGRGRGPSLYVGGFFSNAGREFAQNIARWDGANWSALPLQIAGAVQSLAVHDDGTGGGKQLYAGGGMFIPVGAAFPFAGVAKWDGAEWSLLQGGTDNVVFRVFGTTSGSAVGNALYAGGSFLAVAGLPAKFMARWQGCLTPQPCAPEDFNCDDVVDGNDLGTLLGSWGPCAGCNTDLNGDGVVDGEDLGALLGAWSP